MVRRPKFFIGKRAKTFWFFSPTHCWKYRYERGKCWLQAEAAGVFRCYTDMHNALRRKEAIVPIRPTPAEGSHTPALPHADPDEWGDDYPLLSAYLTDPTWTDGTVRKAALIFVKPILGMWEYTLKEPNLDLIMTVHVSQPQKGLEALEAALKHPAPPWRADPWAKPRKGKR